MKTPRRDIVRPGAHADQLFAQMRGSLDKPVNEPVRENFKPKSGPVTRRLPSLHIPVHFLGGWMRGFERRTGQW